MRGDGERRGKKKWERCRLLHVLELEDIQLRGNVLILYIL
jgi:hypothetical protein